MLFDSNEQVTHVHVLPLTKIMQTELIVSNMAHAPTKSTAMERRLLIILRHCVGLVVVNYWNNCVSTEALSTHARRLVDSFIVFFPAWPSVSQLHISFTSFILWSLGRTIIIQLHFIPSSSASLHSTSGSIHSFPYPSPRRAFASIRTIIVSPSRRHFPSSHIYLPFFTTRYYSITYSSLLCKISLLHHIVFIYWFIIKSKQPRKRRQKCRSNSKRPNSNASFTVADRLTSNFNGVTYASQAEQNCLSRHAPSATDFSSHTSQPVHLEKAFSDGVEVVKRAPRVTNYSSPHLIQHMQSDEVVIDYDKIDDTRKNVVRLPTVPSVPPSNYNKYSSQKETEDKAFMILHTDELNSSFDIFEYIDDDFFSDKQSDIPPFHDLIKKEEPPTCKDDLETASSIICSLQWFMNRSMF